MKRLSVLLLILALLLPCVSCAAAQAETADFTIQNGVLVKYTGNAANVTIPGEAHVIGASAFEGNTYVKTVTFHEGVYEISDRAFYGCTSLTTVKKAGSVTSVGAFAFNVTPFFDRSTDEFLKVGSCVIWYNGTDAAVTLPSGITAIAPYAFLRCLTMTSFKANSGLVNIGDGAFYGCTSLKTLSLPSSVYYIGGYAFEGTAFLNNSGDFPAVNGILLKYRGTAASVKLPSSVKRIAPYAFYDNATLTSVTIPSSVFSIDADAFGYCSSLSTLNLSSGLVNIGDYAFESCTSLNTLETPATLAYIGVDAFKNDTGLMNASIDGSNLTISYHAFENCYSLRYVLLSSGVTELYDGAFTGCRNLKAISVPSSLKTFGSGALSGTSGVVVSTVPGAAAAKMTGCTVNTDKGDVDRDGEMTIMDATRVQRWLADIVELPEAELCISDIDYDSFISVMDVTRIQRILAGIS